MKNTSNRLALSAFRDQCPSSLSSSGSGHDSAVNAATVAAASMTWTPTAIKLLHELLEQKTLVRNNSSAEVEEAEAEAEAEQSTKSVVPTLSLNEKEEVEDIASASLPCSGLPDTMQMVSRNALSANRGKRDFYEMHSSSAVLGLLQTLTETAPSAVTAADAVAAAAPVGWTQQVKWTKTGRMKIVRKRKKIEIHNSASDATDATLALISSSSSFFVPIEEEEEMMEEYVATTTTMLPLESSPSSFGWFPSMQDWKRHADPLVWKRGTMQTFHHGYFRRCAALMTSCFLRFGRLIVQKWIMHNMDTLCRRTTVQLQAILWLKEKTIYSVYNNKFPILYQFLEMLPIDICVNTGLIWLRADLEDLCVESGYTCGGMQEIQDWMELFVLRVVPWFVRVFFMYNAPTSQCPLTNTTSMALLPQLELTWVKKACLDPHNLWNTLSIFHHNTVKKQTLSIPLLGVRQQGPLHVEEEKVLREVQYNINSMDGVGSSNIVTNIFFHSHLMLPSWNRAVQTRSQARICLQEDEKKIQQLWLHNISGTKRLLLWIPRLQPVLALFTQLTKHSCCAAAAAVADDSSSDFTKLVQWLDPLKWSLPSSGKMYLHAFSATRCITKTQSKQLLCHAESEVQWIPLLQDLKNLSSSSSASDAAAAAAAATYSSLETTPWMIYLRQQPEDGLGASSTMDSSTRIRACYCFCNRHAFPLLKRITFFVPVPSYRIGMVTDAYGIDLIFLDDCGDFSSSSSSSKRSCMLRFFNSCHLSETTKTSVKYLSEQTTVNAFAKSQWELHVTPVYHSCCVFKDNQATVFKLKPFMMQMPQRHLLFQSSNSSIGKYEYKPNIAKWVKK